MGKLRMEEDLAVSNPTMETEHEVMATGEKWNNEGEFRETTKGDELEPKNIGINQERVDAWSGCE